MGEVEIDQAIALILISGTMQGWYTYNITRSEFSGLIIQFITKSTGNSIDNVLTKAGKKNSTTFKDTTNKDVLAANALGIVSGKDNQMFDPDLKGQEIIPMQYEEIKSFSNRLVAIKFSIQTVLSSN